MVETQIESRAICDENVLNAMKKIPRHRFVDSHFGAAAYGDWPLPIGEGQTISQPYIVALMTELLCVGSSSRILEIGTGSGYQAAVLAEIVEKVYTIEIVPSLSQKAQKTLDGLGYGNVKFKIGDGFLGWPEYAPYDGILVTCAPTEIPQPLLDQLADGGRLVIPVGDYFQRLKIVERRSGQIKIFENIPVRFVPMTGISQGKNGK